MNIFKSFNFSLAKKRSWSRLKISAPVLAKKPQLRPAPQHCNQEPNMILTMTVFRFFKDLKLTDVKSNRLRKCKNNMFWIRSRSRSRRCQKGAAPAILLFRNNVNDSKLLPVPPYR